MNFLCYKANRFSFLTDDITYNANLFNTIIILKIVFISYSRLQNNIKSFLSTEKFKFSSSTF